MGKRGPKKEPVELKLLKGTREPHRDPAPVAKAYGVPGNPFDPEGSPGEHAAYEDITRGMTTAGLHIVLTAADFGALEAAAIALHRARRMSELEATLLPEQRFVETRANGLVEHAYTRAAKSAWKEWRAFAADLGLSPTARASVSAAKPSGSTPEQDDPLLAAMARVSPIAVE